MRGLYREHKNQLIVGVLVVLLSTFVLWAWDWLIAFFPLVLAWLKGQLTAQTSLPRWAILLNFIGIFAGVARIATQIKRAHAASGENARLQAELEELKNPANPELDINQTHVLFWVALSHDSSSSCSSTELAQIHNTPVFVIDAIADQLKGMGLLQKKRLLSDPLSLTAKGRQHMARREVLEQYNAFKHSKGLKRLGEIS
ncbi:hypothetical protein [Pseudomonas sp. MBLB4136]|uniref:hypothetical protein n=1 Tax=Pseudomonas sp. MBLB4136 TaxID=3451558 RepID=UPI003F753E21